MVQTEIDELSRAHQMFVGGTWHASVDAGTGHYPDLLQRVAGPNAAAGQGRYRVAVHRSREALLTAARTDAAATAVLAGAHRDRMLAHELTKGVLDEARTDAAVAPATPMAQREAIRRRAARLRAQRAHVLAARARVRRHVAALRALHYRQSHHRGAALAGLRLPPTSGRAAAAVRAALSRLGRPYVWGATGPNQFDCSGLVQWAYAQAGIHLDRTTYQQINDGIPDRGHKSGRAISSFRMPDTYSWRSATIWSSKRPIRAHRCGSAGWATTCRSVGRLREADSMAEQTGPSAAGIQARQAVLVSRHSAMAGADGVLTEVLASAHAEMRESVRRLDAIAAEIDRAVSDQSAVDTPLGAREFQRFLVAKEREIAAVVAHARELAQSKSTVLQGLREHYAAPRQGAS